MSKNRKKNRPLSVANQARQSGYPALGTTKFNGQDFNNVGNFNAPVAEYINLWQYYDLNQNVSKFEWSGLPDGLTSWVIERMLYLRGAVAGFMLGGFFYILPFTAEAGDYNPYGMPTKITPVPFNGEKLGKFARGFKLPVNANGTKEVEYQAVLLFDNIPINPSGGIVSRFALNNVLIKEIADTLARIKLNIVISNKKIFIQVPDPAQRDIVEKELALAFGSESPFAVITSEMPAQTIQSTSDLNAMELFNAIKNYDAIRCSMSGISSKGFGAEKKERLVTGELTGQEEEKDLVLMFQLYMRQQFCDMCNKRFGQSLSVELRLDKYRDPYTTETNWFGNNPNDEVNGKEE